MDDHPRPSGDRPQPAPDGGGGGGAPPTFAAGPHRRGTGPPVRRWLALGVAAVIVAALAAGAAALLALRGTGDLLLDQVPEDATVYVAAYLDPSAGQKLNFRRLVGKFPEVRDIDRLNREVDRLLDEGLRRFGLSSRDVRSWLGSQVSLTVRVEGGGPQVAVLVASRDDAAARAALDRARAGPLGREARWEDRTHRGVTVSVGSEPVGLAYALVEHTVVVASDPALVDDIIDASQGRAGNLGASEAYRRTVEPLPRDSLGVAYVNPRPLVEQLERSAGLAGVPGLGGVPGTPGRPEAITGLGMAVRAEGDGLAAHLSLSVDPSRLSEQERRALEVPPHQNRVLAFTPPDAYGVMAVTGLRQSASALLEQAGPPGRALPGLPPGLDLDRLVESLTGDAGVEVSPGTSGPFPEGAVLIGVADEQAAREVLEQVAALAAGAVPGLPPGTVPGWKEETYRDAVIRYLSVPDLASAGVEPAFTVARGMAILASSRAEARAVLDAGATGRAITSSPSYRAAIARVDARNHFLLYVDVEAVTRDVRRALPPEALAEFERDAAPNLEPVKAFVMTATGARDRTTLRMFTLIR